MKNFTKKGQELFDKYQYLMRYGNQIGNSIDAMYKKGVAVLEINSFFAQQKENIKGQDIIDFVRGTRNLFSWQDLNWNNELLKQFVIDHRLDISVADLYGNIFQSDPVFGKDVEGWDWLNRINASNVETALCILFILEGQNIVENKILEEYRASKVNKYVLYRIVRAYLSMYESHDLGEINLDFAYELTNALFVSFPGTPYKDDKDLLLISLKRLYSSASETNNEKIEIFLSEYPLTLFGQIRNILHDNQDRSDENITSNKDILNFIKEHVSEFSYEEFLERAINCKVSESITMWELKILDTLKGQEQVDKDIKKKYAEGKISTESWDYLLYIRPSLSKS